MTKTKIPARPAGGQNPNKSIKDKSGKIKTIDIEIPLKMEDIKKLKAGGLVLLTGEVFTMRDAGHKRMAEALKKKHPVPIDLNNQTIFYAGPTPEIKTGRVIGSIGPTTASRMDQFMPQFLNHGLRATIGKGPRSEEVKMLHKKYKAIYFVATGGIAALLARHVTEAKKIAYEDLGAEAVFKLKLYQFPAIVAYDSKGGDLFA